MTDSVQPPYPSAMKDLMAKKSEVLSKARALDDLGLPETAQPLWQEAASLEDLVDEAM